MEQTRQLDAWTGEFGQAYLERNAEVEHEGIAGRHECLQSILDACLVAPGSILEVGCHVGLNLLALARTSVGALHAVEPFKGAYHALLDQPNLTLASAHNCDGSALPFDDGSVDLVFTSGVLIHVAPNDVAVVMGEIVRVARRYVWCNEYFAKTPEAVPYRGEDGLLFKRDFGRFYLEQFPSLRPIATGFLWSATTPFDDTTWWLFKKTRDQASGN